MHTMQLNCSPLSTISSTSFTTSLKIMDTAIPKTLVNFNFDDIVLEAKDYACINGIGCRPKTNLQDGLQMCPLTLFPTPFPRKEFELANDVQIIMNELMHKVSFDLKFLNESLESTIKVDSFTKQLLELNNDVERIGTAQDVSFGLFRTDYMIDDSIQQHPSNHSSDGGDKYRLKQVESNAIASSFSGLSPKVGSMHRYLIAKYEPKKLQYLPSNPATHNVALSFIESFDYYGKPGAIILFVTEDWTINIADQRIIEHKISEIRPDIKILRRPFTDLHVNGTHPIKMNENRELIVDGQEVAVVYYRHLYDPDHYNQGNDSWKLRQQIELSKAIKCPSINYHLSGVKKLQQILSKEEVLEKFLPPKDVQLLIQTFTGLHGLDLNSKSGDAAVEMGLSHPERFVLKPQREGGGNNWYGDDIINVLEPIKTSKEREAFILMSLIKPPVISNYFISANQETSIEPVDTISELGIYGSIMGSKCNLLFNRNDGHLLRSKKLGVNEGGIAAGYGALDSPLLYD